MKKPTRLLLYLLAAVLGGGSTALAQTPSAAEIELRRRIAQLEAQNAAILEQLAEIQSRLPQTPANVLASRGVEVASTTPIVPSTIAAAAAAPQAAPAQAAAPPTVQTEGNRSMITFYGFARLDAVFEDSRINSSQTPTFVPSEAEGAENRSNFTLHPRLTRFGMNYRQAAPMDTMDGATLSGRIELDFHNAGSNSRAIPRYRHVFLNLAWGPHSILAGQTSDIISPLFPTVNSDTLMWNAGNLGDRRAQFRYAFGRATGVNLQFGAGLTGAIDGQDRDANGVLDGEQSTMPNFQGRLGYASAKVIAGVWSHYGRTHTDTAFAGKNDFDHYSYGADFDLRFTPQVSLRGEAFAGSALSDVRGSVGQSFNTTTGKEIDSRGGWIELGIRPGRYFLSLGHTVDDPKNGHVPANGQTLNRSWYVTNQFRLAPPVTAGIDYTFWQTRFKGLPEGTDNRINLYLMYGF
jgi:hypothetical protein